MNGETPVKTCEYCPPPTPECTMGYEFIWNAYLGDTISSQAVVTDNAFGTDGDYFSKPNCELIFDKVYDLFNELDPKAYPPLK